MAKKEIKFYPKWPVLIRNGRILHKDEETFREFLVPYEGKEMDLIVKDKVKDRSRQEEKFYHAVVVRMVADAMDVTDNEAHELLKGMFLKMEGRAKNGMRYERVMSTTELADKAYRDYWEKCIKWAALPTLDDGLSERSGLGLAIPYPNEVWYDQYQ